MKLVEILARELVEWPENCSTITQDHDGEINYCGNAPRFCHDIKQWLAGSGCSCDNTYYDLAEDYATAIITRDQWQAERDRIAGVTVSVEIQSTDGPLDWRDRIREIDARQIALTAERAELVAKLAAEGLALCGEPIKAATPAEDMSDPSKWKEGDLIEIIGDDSHHFEVGEIVRLQVFELDHHGDGHRYEHLDKRDYWWVKHKCAKFHSRP